MFSIVLDKLKHKRWMVLSLLIGNILLIAIACASPLYMDGVLGRLLTRSLEDKLYETNRHPLMISIESGIATALGGSSFSLQEYDMMAAELPAAYGVDTLATVRFMSSARLSVVPDVIRDGVKSVDVNLASINGLDEQIEIISGTMYGDRLPAAEQNSRTIDVIISQSAMVSKNLLLGDLLTLRDTNISEDLIEAQGNIVFRVAGIFKAKNPQDPFWIRPESFYTSHMLVSESVLNDLLRPGYNDFMADLLADDPAASSAATVPSLASISGTWNVVFDYTKMTPDDVEVFRARNNEYIKAINSKRNIFAPNFIQTLADFSLQARQTQVTLSLLQIPIYLLLLAFIFMVSKQLLRMEMNEIAVFKSRGASRWQVFGIYALQSFLIAALALVFAIPLSFFLTNVIGSSDSFLSFVSRESLPLRFQLSFILAAAISLAVGMFTMIVPAFRQSKTTIVEQKQQLQALDQKKPIWQRLWLDLILLAVSIYALYSFNQQKDSIATRVAEGQGTDGLLFLSSSLFMVGVALTVWRVLPLLISLIYRIGKDRWHPAFYLSFLQTIRSRNRQAFISIFLMLTMSIGLFSAITARTINENARAQIRYLNGSDLVVREFWRSNAEAVAEDPELDLIYEEPDYGIYQDMPEVEAIARVYTNESIEVRGRNVSIKQASLMGIHTREFGETVNMDDYLLPEHINTYLNAMSTDQRAVLVSENFRTKQGLDIGSVIYYSDKSSDSVYGVIAGFVPYWPGYQPTTTTKYTDGSTIVADNYLVVAHLAEVQSGFGITPYNIWMRLNGDSQFMYDFAEAQKNPEIPYTSGQRTFTRFDDSAAKIVEMNQDPVLQGTNGLLTISYLVVLILCAVGFLIYWILSIRSRTLIFGIFRAMGLRFGELIQMLVNEQICVTLPALLVGAGIGFLAARLYVPLIMLAYSAQEQVIPLRIQYAGADFGMTFAIVMMTIVACLLVLAWQIRQINIAQALKLGED